MDAVKLTKFDDAQTAYFSYEEDARKAKEPVMSYGRFVEFWAGLKGHARPKASQPLNAHTSHKEDEMPGKLKSPYLHDDADVAYAAYCKMPHLKREGATKLTKRQFKRTFAEKHAAAIAKQDVQSEQLVIDPTTNEPDWSQFDPAVLEKLRSMGIGVPESEPVVEDEPDVDTIVAAVLAVLGKAPTATIPATPARTYRQRLTKEQIAEQYPNAARNKMLWVLNTEGFLAIVPEGGQEPIAQEDGTEILSETFGPLETR